MGPAPTLVLAWGNPSRGDDALGPLFAEAIDRLRIPGVECLTDFQLQVEHALDLRGRDRVLFVDASASALDAPFVVARAVARRAATVLTHAMSPEGLLEVFERVEGRPAPEAWVLGIRGAHWSLGAPPSAAAEHDLGQALAWAAGWLAAR